MDDRGYPGPTYAETIQALKAKEIRQVGIAVDFDAREDLAAVASATGTFAPPGGTDCNGDGTTEVAPGQPLICDGTGRGLAPAIVGLLKGIRDEAEVALGHTGPEVVTMLSPPVRVNVRAPQRLTYRARIACRPEHYGDTVRAGVHGVSRGRILAEAAVTVTCVGPPPPRPFVYVPPVQRPPVAAAAIGPPPPPPAPVTNPNPNPNPNPQVNPQPHVQAQPGVAAREQEQAQLALAHADAGMEWELQMSSVRRETDPALAWAAATLLAGAAAAAGTRLRSGTRVARSRVRR